MSGPGPLPFREVLDPLLARARRRAVERAGPAARHVDELAWGGLEDDFAEALLAVLVRPLYRAFAEARSRARGAPPRRSGDPPLAEGVHGAFLRQMREGGLDRLVEDHPVLGRVLEGLAEEWIASAAELAGRLETDRRALKELFGEGRAMGPVVEVEPGLSDRHRGGRTVARLTFESGTRVLHKPRSLEPERAFYGFLDWLHEALDDESVHPTLLPREGYGWMGDVSHRPCRDGAEARLFYRRSGRLLAALHALRATDVHAGNVIASGGHPIPIDLETLLQPRLPGPEPGEPLLGVGVLPSWKRGLDGRRYDVGALTGSAAVGGWPRVWHARGIGTDAMEISMEYRSTPGTEHLPVLDGAPLRAIDYGAEIEAGYAEAHRRLAEHGRAGASSAGILEAFGNLRVRVLPRPTIVYAAACHIALEPGLLRDGAGRTAAIERFLAGGGPAGGPPASGILPGEREAIERMDVPLFHAHADGVDLEAEGGGGIRGRFAQSGLSRARVALEKLDEPSRARSLALIRSALALAAVSTALPTARPGDRAFPIPGSPP